MVGSNVLVNILKPVNIVNLGDTLRCGVEFMTIFNQTCSSIITYLLFLVLS